jgi:hypothetical protein
VYGAGRSRPRADYFESSDHRLTTGTADGGIRFDPHVATRIRNVLDG